MEQNCLNLLRGKWGIFDFTRLRYDPCFIATDTVQSMGPGKYETFNYYDCECETPGTWEVALQQPTVLFKDGYGWTSQDGCNIDNDSRLRNARNLTNPRLIQQLFTPPFPTVPYMGRGIGDQVAESWLRAGEDTGQGKACNNLAGVYIDRYDPQIPCIKETIQNPVHLIQEVNDITWVRGGAPSRQIIRNKDYLERCGFQWNGKYWARP